ncbi:oligoendopeptidase F [Paenibacillus cellulositrophicus]|uniref:oligoendopeptidase F n=1 Tax=Paenibacillus cellulositrophicus TaxID=562959 RepID=UPI0020421199|nr:oligoendopeptidase F [Paenibacillus cellulositrophicus]MCM2998229.1 oligoendopeptidase F [Paenibacillus cellulositrophicus]
MSKILTRAEVPVETTWNLDDIFPSKEAWEQELNDIQRDIGTVTKYEGELSQGADTLLACLQAQEELSGRMSRAGAYAYLHQSGDSINPENQTNASKARDLASQVSSALSFIKSEIIALPDGTIDQYIADQPELREFERSLRLLLQTKPHRLTAETEKVLASLGEVLDAPYRIYERSKLADMTFKQAVNGEGEEVPVSFALYENKYCESPDTELRRNSFKAFSDTLHKYRNTFAEAYGTEVKRQVIESRLRGYESVTDMLLQPQQVTKEMYNNVLDILQEELAPHMRRYAALKKKVLQLDEMTFADLKAPLDPDYNPEISFQEAGELIKEALAILGPEYGEIVTDAFRNRWVDYADNAGKRTGAFCSSIPGVHSYILISWSDSMRGAFTLAHEVGHAGHLMLAAKYQRLTNARPSLYFIEAPSTMNELLLADHLLTRSNEPRMRRWVISQLLGTYFHNFVTHLLEGELQRRVYDLAMKNVPITAVTLCELKGDILSSFWGADVVIDEEAKLTWMRQPHYYMSLYPYTYAAGLSASTAVAKLIREEGQPAVDRWLEVLKAGGSMSPLELMKLAGVDMSQPDPIRSAAAYVGSLIDELESLY